MKDMGVNADPDDPQPSEEQTRKLRRVGLMVRKAFDTWYGGETIRLRSIL